MSQRFTARFLDAQRSSGTELSVTVDAEGYLDVSNQQLSPLHFSHLKISDRVGNSMRYLNLPDGRRLETWDNDVIDALCRQWQPNKSGFIHGLESNLQWVLLTLVFVLGTGFVFFTQGIPALSGFITAHLPTSLDDALGGQVLEQMDEFVFQPSTLAEERQASLNRLFEQLKPADQRHYQLNFRHSETIGANAFALPNGDIVFTDDLIRLADDDQMLAAIMLHEIGHVKERHAMQTAVSQASISMLVLLLTGDINTAGSTLLLFLPNFFLQSRYSQGLEWSADSYALEQMQARNMDPNDFADIMEKLSAGDSGNEDEREDGLAEYFSSHPPSAKRIERFRDN